MSMLAAPFDRIAESYDATWTSTAIGHAQRAAVWRVVDSQFKAADHVLDLGCGTGADAVHLMSSRVRVTAVDPSGAMVRRAIAKGVDARQLAIEDLSTLAGSYDGALSNFGALNCVENMASPACELARLIRPGGRLVVCLMGRFCLWETGHYLYRGELRKAFRRLRGHASTSFGLIVRYPSVRQVIAAFAPEFVLKRWSGVGICVPPSFIAGYSQRTIECLARIDSRVANWPPLRAISDHRLLVLIRR